MNTPIDQLWTELGAAETALELFEIEHGQRSNDIDTIFEHDLRLRRVTEAKGALRVALAQADGNYPSTVEWP